GIDAMRDPQPAEISSVSDETLQSLTDRIDAIQQSVGDFNERLAKIEKVFGSLPIDVSAGTDGVGIVINDIDEEVRTDDGMDFDEAPPRIASTTSSDGKPPLKPTIIEDMSLKGVSRGMAWVKTSN